VVKRDFSFSFFLGGVNFHVEKMERQMDLKKGGPRRKKAQQTFLCNACSTSAAVSSSSPPNPTPHFSQIPPHHIILFLPSSRSLIFDPGTENSTQEKVCLAMADLLAMVSSRR